MFNSYTQEGCNAWCRFSLCMALSAVFLTCKEIHPCGFINIFCSMEKLTEINQLKHALEVVVSEKGDHEEVRSLFYSSFTSKAKRFQILCDITFPNTGKIYLSCSAVQVKAWCFIFAAWSQMWRIEKDWGRAG